MTGLEIWGALILIGGVINFIDPQLMIVCLSGCN
jgi:hypothetical protein